MMKKLCLLPLLFALLAAIAVVIPWNSSPPKKKTSYVIAMVQLSPVDDDTVLGFREGMAQLGYREGSEVVYLGAGPAGSSEALEEIVRQHLKEKPDLIVASSTPATLAVQRLTADHRQPPVIFAPVNDPLNAGIVTDLRSPGGHITGIRLPKGDDLRLQWLQRIVPGIRRVYLPYTADDKSSLASLQQATEAAGKLGIRLLPQAIKSEGDLAEALAALPADIDAIYLPRDSRIEAAIDQFVAIAEKRRLPISAPGDTQVQAGALYSYGFLHRDIGHQAARLADQVLKGVSPGDLPVEMAESRLAINLKAARRLGIAISDDVLVQAQYVVPE